MSNIEFTTNIVPIDKINIIAGPVEFLVESSTGAMAGMHAGVSKVSTIDKAPNAGVNTVSATLLKGTMEILGRGTETAIFYEKPDRIKHSLLITATRELGSLRESTPLSHIPQLTDQLSAVITNFAKNVTPETIFEIIKAHERTHKLQELRTQVDFAKRHRALISQLETNNMPEARANSVHTMLLPFIMRYTLSREIQAYAEQFALTTGDDSKKQQLMDTLRLAGISVLAIICNIDRKYEEISRAGSLAEEMKRGREERWAFLMILGDKLDLVDDIATGNITTQDLMRLAGKVSTLMLDEPDKALAKLANPSLRIAIDQNLFEHANLLAEQFSVAEAVS